MSRWYSRYMNRPEKLYDRPGLFRRKDSAPVPGNINDTRPHIRNNKLRFNKWYKLPVAAHKLYWRQKGKKNETLNSQRTTHTRVERGSSRFIQRK